MTLRIERICGARETRIRLSGQLRSEHLSQVKSEVQGAEQPVVLDLEEVDLVDIDGVRFLNECESAGISVLRCSPYIREWMQRERSQTEAPPEK
jgi:anti-anti-sigma regulatory factor